MHELGHTLGLRHGGADDVGCKANYVSVMNYFFQAKDVHASRKLNYSESALASIDENNLVESSIIPGFPLDTIYWGRTGTVVSGSPVSLGEVDWNENGTIQSVPYDLDINYFTPKDCIDGTKTVLTGHEDWSNLRFDFRAYSDGNMAVAGALPAGEMDPESLFATGASLDSDGDGVANADDNCIVTANPGQADLNGNGFGDACEPASAATDLSATISASPSTAQVGSNLTLTLTATNGGTSPEGQVFLSQVLPDGVTFVSVTSSQGRCQRNGSAVGCDLGALGASASLTVTVVLQPLSIGIITTSVEGTRSLVEIGPSPMSTGGSYSPPSQRGRRR